LNRPSGFTRALLIGAAACTTLFWILALVIGSFAGYQAVQHPLWIPSQLLHVIGALLVIPAIPALMSNARSPYGESSMWAGALAMIGSALSAADGVIALSVFPTLADNARMLLDATGAMNGGIMLGTYIAIGAINMFGWIAVGAALWKGRMRNWSVGLLIAGAVLFNLPPGPVPLVVLAIGGVLWSAALVVLALDSIGPSSDTAPMRRMQRG
jgi:hypothetical protein